MANNVKQYLIFLLFSCMVVFGLGSLYNFYTSKITESELTYFNDNIQKLLLLNDFVFSEFEEQGAEITLADNVVLKNILFFPEKIIIYEIATLGYGGELEFFVLVQDYKVLDFAILSSNETPGIGNVFANKVWLSYFKKDLKDGYIKNFDTIAGATISSGAVGNAILALEKFIRNDYLGQPNEE